jgi:pyruvate kinase
MARIAYTTEDNLLFVGPPRDVINLTATSITDAISQAVCGIGRELQADAIITTTTSGFTARMVSRNRPKLPIYAITHEERTVRRLSLVWGVISLACPPYESTDDMLFMAEKVVLEKGLVKEGDKVIITAGIPIGTSGQSNLLKVHIVGQN